MILDEIELLQGTIPFSVCQLFTQAHRVRDQEKLALLVRKCKLLGIHDKEINKVSKQALSVANEQLDKLKQAKRNGDPLPKRPPDADQQRIQAMQLLDKMIHPDYSLRLKTDDWKVLGAIAFLQSTIAKHQMNANGGDET